MPGAHECLNGFRVKSDISHFSAEGRLQLAEAAHQSRTERCRVDLPELEV